MPKNKERKDWSNWVASLSTGIFAVISIITSYITFTSWVNQREAARPYFIFKDPPQIQENYPIRLEFVFKNSGSNPATELRSKHMVFPSELSGEPLLVKEHRIVNDFPKDAFGTLVVSLTDIGFDLTDSNQIPPQFIVIDLTYADPIIKRKYSQTFFLKWLGIRNGTIQPLIHAEYEDKQRIEIYLKKHNLYLLSMTKGFNASKEALKPYV